jgi:hypothetical protein
MADTLRAAMKPQGETWTPEEIEREVRLQRSIGRHKIADTLEAFLTEGRRAAVKRLPRTQKKRPKAARKVDARRRAWLALRDRLDPDHLEPIGRIHREIDAVLSSYRRERWPLHKDRDSAPPRGASNCDDLLWRLCRITGVKTIRVTERTLRKYVGSILADGRF